MKRPNKICVRRDTSHTETENCHGGTATCTANAVCEVCKAEYGEKLPHDFTAETVDAKYLKSAATCTVKAVYYKSCAVCGLSSEGTADEATFFSGNALDHDWGAWTPAKKAPIPASVSVTPAIRKPRIASMQTKITNVISAII